MEQNETIFKNLYSCYPLTSNSGNFKFPFDMMGHNCVAEIKELKYVSDSKILQLIGVDKLLADILTSETIPLYETIDLIEIAAFIKFIRYRDMLVARSCTIIRRHFDFKGTEMANCCDDVIKLVSNTDIPLKDRLKQMLYQLHNIAKTPFDMSKGIDDIDWPKTIETMVDCCDHMYGLYHMIEHSNLENAEDFKRLLEITLIASYQIVEIFGMCTPAVTMHMGADDLRSLIRKHFNRTDRLNNVSSVRTFNDRHREQISTANVYQNMCSAIKINSRNHLPLCDEWSSNMGILRTYLTNIALEAEFGNGFLGIPDPNYTDLSLITGEEEEDTDG